MVSPDSEGHRRILTDTGDKNIFLGYSKHQSIFRKCCLLANNAPGEFWKYCVKGPSETKWKDKCIQFVSQLFDICNQGAKGHAV